jgi:hypothetical protein
MDAFWRSGLPIYSIFPYPVIERYSPSSNLIPPHSGELDARQRLARFSNHVIDKSKKIWANIALKAQDRRMRQEIGGFRQIFDE